MTEAELRGKLEVLQLQVANLQTSFNWFRGIMLGIYVTIIAPLGVTVFSNHVQ